SLGRTRGGRTSGPCRRADLPGSLWWPTATRRGVRMAADRALPVRADELDRAAVDALGAPHDLDPVFDRSLLGLEDLAQDPAVDAALLQMSDGRVDGLRCEDGREAHAQVEGALEVGLRDTPQLGDELEDRRQGPARAVEASVHARRQDASNVRGKAAAGDV